MFIQLLVCFIAVIVMAIAIAIIWAPFSIEIRINKEKSIEFQIGDCMPDVWVCSYWFAIIVHIHNDDPEAAYSYMTYHFWEMNSGKYINGKTTPDWHDDGDEYLPAIVVDESQFHAENRQEQDDDEHWNELLERARARREDYDRYL